MVDLIKITADKEKVKSILNMVEVRESRILNTDKEKYTSLLVEDYYELIKELTTALMDIEGYKTLSHKTLFDWLKGNFKEFQEYEFEIIDDLRKTRNKIVYDGFFVKSHYLDKKSKTISIIISKLKALIKERI